MSQSIEPVGSATNPPANAPVPPITLTSAQAAAASQAQAMSGTMPTTVKNLSDLPPEIQNGLMMSIAWDIKQEIDNDDQEFHDQLQQEEADDSS